MTDIFTPPGFVRRVNALVACVVLCGATAAASAQSEAEELRAWLREYLPRKGAIHAVYEAAETDHVSIFGFDAETGAWYGSFLGKLFAKDPAGALYKTSQPYGRVERWEGNPGEVSDTALDDPFPFVTLRFIAENAHRAERIRRARDGGWAVTYSFPLGDRNLLDWTPRGTYVPENRARIYHINGEGRLESIEWSDWDADPRIIIYADSEMSSFPIAASFGVHQGWRLAKVSYDRQPGAPEFSIEAVTERARSAGILERVTRWSVASASSDPAQAAEPSAVAATGAESSRRPAPPFPEAPRRSSLDWPIVGVGVVFVAVGVYAWFRRR